MKLKAELQIMFLNIMFDKTMDRFIASCLQYLWKEVSIHGLEHANLLTSKQKYHVEQKLKYYNLNFKQEMKNFYDNLKTPNFIDLVKREEISNNLLEKEEIKLLNAS